MSIGIHVARVEFTKVDGTGNKVDKDSNSTTLGSHLIGGGHEHRIIPNPSLIPNTAGNPDVKTYLELEANDDYVMEYMDQNTIITYLRTASGGFA